MGNSIAKVSTSDDKTNEFPLLLSLFEIIALLSPNHEMLREISRTLTEKRKNEKNVDIR